MWWHSDDIRNAARGAWASVLAHFGVDASRLVNKHGPCPGCGGRDRFRFDDKNGEGTWLCSGGGGGKPSSGDGLALLMHCLNVEFKEACRLLGEYLLPDGGRKDGGGDGVRHVPEVAAEPRREVEKHPRFQSAKLREFVGATKLVTRAALQGKSPVPVEGVTASAFLDALYPDDAKVLVFTSQYSQGDFIHWLGKGDFRLSQTRGVKAVGSPLPKRGPEGVWFLVQPVSGQWAPNGDKWTRRGQQCVQAWPYMVLESDEADEALWLTALCKMPLPIVAMYSSGGRSVHALVRVNATSKPEWDEMRDVMSQWLCPLGADAGALSAVRLSRLPGCMREGSKGKDGKWVKYDRPRMQELIWLNPMAKARAMVGM